MAITDELRKYAGRLNDEAARKSEHGFSPFAMALEGIADRIDAAHERECKGQYACGAERGIGVSIEASMIHDRGFIELPKDADGEYIHIGDELVLQRKVWEKPYVVQGITWDGEDWYFTCDEGFFNAVGWIHYHEPTVEDVLRDAILHCVGHSPEYWGEPIAECAAKLQLRGDAE